MTFPSVQVDIAFTTDPLATPSWTALPTSGNGAPLSLHITTGRQMETDEVQPGTLTAELDNSDRRYDPNHASGPYYGNLRPRKRIRVRATYLGVTYDLYYGFGGGYLQRYSPPAMGFTTISASDWFALLAGVTGSVTISARLVSGLDPTGWWRLGDPDATGGAFDSSGNGLNGTYNGGTFEFGVLGAVVGDPDTAITMTAGTPNPIITLPAAAAVTGTGPFTAIIWYKGCPATSDVLFYQGTTGDLWALFLVVSAGPPVTVAIASTVSGGGFGFPALSLSSSSTEAFADAESWHMVGFTRNGTTQRLYWDGVEVATGTGTAASLTEKTPQISWTTADPIAVDEAAIWNDLALTADEMLELYQAAGTPWTGDTTGERIDRFLDILGVEAADRDIDAGESTLGYVNFNVAALLEQIHKINVTEDGRFLVNHHDGGKIMFRGRFSVLDAARSTVVQATFTDDPAAGAGSIRFEPDDLTLFRDEQLIYNEAAVTWVGGTAIYTDDTSVDRYGLRTREVDTLLMSGQEADDRARWIVGHYKEPFDRLSSLKLRPSANADLWVACLTLREDDLVAFRLLPQNTGTAIELNMLIQGVEHSITNGVNEWETTFYLTPADLSSYWLLGTSLLGSSTFLSY